MSTQVRSRLVIGSSLDSSIGRISIAGYIRHSTGVPFSNMRILGSYALVYILDGRGRYTDVRGMDQKVAAGDLITVFPEIAHAYGPGEREYWDEIYIVFDGPVFDLWRRQGVLDDSRPIGRLEPIEHWMRLIESVASSAKQSALQAVCRLQEVMGEIHDYQRGEGLDGVDRVWLGRAKSLLAQGRAEDFEVESVAEKLGISYVGFRKKFARLAGAPPARFHMKSVMDRACDLIRRQGATNRQIAVELGFCDEFHFSKRFKQLVGLSPREFRKRTGE